MSNEWLEPKSDAPQIPYLNDLSTSLGYAQHELESEAVDGGHMAYGRWFVTTPESATYFAKGHQPELFTDAKRASHAQQYLDKEQRMFAYLRDNQYSHVPQYSELLGGSLLVMDALAPKQGWIWRADEAPDTHEYVESALACFAELAKTPIAPEDHFFPQRILKVYMEEGWDYLDQETIPAVQERLTQWLPRFHSRTQQWALALLPRIQDYLEPGRGLYDIARPLYLSHHDARQANLAYHPDHGAMLIDWSWADVGFKNADSTMFLIDVAKSGLDTATYLKEHFNPEHALLLMGHWLGRSIQPTRDGDTTVRFHQLTSAVTAYELLEQYAQLEIGGS